MTGFTFEFVSGAKAAIEKVLTHYMPDDEAHSHCYYLEYDWCKTVQHIHFGKHNATCINKCSALKSPLPLGIRRLFIEWLYSTLLSDTAIRILLKPGCTSLNESFMRWPEV
eukprot:205823_1